MTDESFIPHTKDKVLFCQSIIHIESLTSRLINYLILSNNCDK